MTPRTKTPSNLTPRLLPFLRSLLEDPSNQSIICWTDRAELQFKIVNREKIASLWGATKRRRVSMTYQNMCRSIREYCSKGKLVKVKGSFFEYRFVEFEGTMDVSADPSKVFNVTEIAPSVMAESENCQENQKLPSHMIGKSETPDFEKKSSRLSNILETLIQRAENAM